MKFIGQATITKYIEQPDGSLVETYRIVEDNVINKRAMNLLIASSVVFDNTRKIAFSVSTSAPNFETQTLSQINSVGVNTVFTYTDRTNLTEPFITYSGTFNPPPANRTINSIGIVDGAELPNDPTATTARNSYTYLLLNTPITQTTVDIIQVSYKIFISWAGSDNVPENYRILIERYFYNNTVPVHAQSRFASYVSFNESEYLSYIASVDTNHGGPLSNSAGQTVVLTESNVAAAAIVPAASTLSYGYNLDWGLLWYRLWVPVISSNYVGAAISKCIYGLLQGVQSNNSTFVYKDKFFAGSAQMNTARRLSNVFSHSVSATAPMYDVGALANSSWKPTVSEQAIPVNNLPSHYLLKVTQSGGIGVGAYKIYKSSYGGWGGNTFVPRCQLHWAVDAVSDYMIETDDTFIWDHRWYYFWSHSNESHKFVSFRRKAGVALLSLTHDGLTEEKKYTLANNTVFGSVINDVAVNPSSNLIYVATQTGLYSINTATDSVTQLSSDACAAVCVGLGGAVFAIFRNGTGSGRLASSLSGFATALNLGAAVINWDNIWRIFIDPQSASYDLMFYQGSCPKNTLQYTPGSFSTQPDRYKIHWYNSTSGFIKTDNIAVTKLSAWNTNGYVDHELMVLRCSNCVHVTNGLWIYPGGARNLVREATYLGTTLNNTASGFSNLEGKTRGGGVPIDIKNDAASTGLGWLSTQFGFASSSPGFGWNAATSTPLVSTAANQLVPLGVSGDYVFSAHAGVPFVTKKFDGMITSVHVGKPTPSSTSYTLYFITSSTINMADRTTESSTTLMPTFHRAQINELGASTFYEYVTDQSELYRTSVENSPRNSGIVNHANIISLPNKQIMFMAPPMFSRRAYLLGDAEPVATNNWSLFKNLPASKVTGGIGFIDCVRQPVADMNDLWAQAYSWNGSAWIEDPANTGPGKPIHTTTEALIDGININWTDLAPGSTQNLMAGQYYNFVKCTVPGSFLVETSTPDPLVNMDIWLRNVQTNTLSGTIATNNTYVLEAPLGSSPDPNFLMVSPIDGSAYYTATINGVPANVVVNASTTPPAGTIHVTSPQTGRIYFNAANIGQSFSFTYKWFAKYHPTEVF